MKKHKLSNFLGIFIFVLAVFLWFYMKFVPSSNSNYFFVILFFPLIAIYGIYSFLTVPKNVIDVRLFYLFVTGFIGQIAFAIMPNYEVVINNVLIYKIFAIGWLLFFSVVSFINAQYYKANKENLSSQFSPKWKLLKAKSNYDSWARGYYVSGYIFLFCIILHFR